MRTAGTETGTAKNKGTGRQGADKQEAVIKTKEVQNSIGELVRLHHASEAASTALSDGIKAVAEKSGLLASVVKKFVNARAGEKFAEKAREVNQLSIVFEDVAEKSA